MADDLDVSENEKSARSMGWRPQEEFRGDPDKWVDADTFVERGRTFLPLLKKDNERLSGDVSKLGGEVQRLTALLEESHTSIETLREFHAEDTARRVKAAKIAVRSEIASASEAGDHARVSELTEQLTDLQIAERDARNAADANKGEAAATVAGRGAAADKDYTKEAWFKDWHAENSWYGKEVVKTAVANLCIQQLRAGGVRDVEGAFLAKVTEATEAEMEKIGYKSPRRVDRVEGGGHDTSDAGGGSKSFAKLPADARAACVAQERKMVGAGKPFKTVKDWQSYFVEYYKEG